MTKIVITGPESSGKTTLARQLSEYFEAPLVPEFARAYIDKLGRPYVEQDLLQIAKGQHASEFRMAKENPALLICDTDLITIKIWSEYKYGQCDPAILEWIAKLHYDHYFLCNPDIPWEFDPQRENPGDRDVLYDRYFKALNSYKKNFSELAGDPEKRLEQAIEIIQSLYLK